MCRYGVGIKENACLCSDCRLLKIFCSESQAKRMKILNEFWSKALHDNWRVSVILKLSTFLEVRNENGLIISCDKITL